MIPLPEINGTFAVERAEEIWKNVSRSLSAFREIRRESHERLLSSRQITRSVTRLISELMHARKGAADFARVSSGA